jgi:glc operon protein GlcG
LRGGLPIVIDGQIIGAIGVSADTPAHDELIAKAGIAALTQ